ncbi:MAG: polysaccharide pyruvyl transferase family protein, partial [Gammaproteobacteria bacterium]
MKRILHFCVEKTENFGDDAIILKIHQDLTDQFGDITIITKKLGFLSQGSIPVFLKNLLGVDLVLIGGGGILSRFFWPFRNSFLKILQALSIPVVFYGVGVGLRVGESIETLPTDSITSWFSYAQKIAVRDIATKQAIETLGIHHAIMVGDPAISWNNTLHPLHN